MYYVIKDALLLYFYVMFRFYKFVFWDAWKILYDKLHHNDDEEYDEEELEEDLSYEEEERTYEKDDITFCQLFNIGSDMCLLVDHVEMCPDETAYIRVVDHDGYTPLYKRKVRRDKKGNRFILFNGVNCYLDNKKTQPTVIRK